MTKKPPIRRVLYLQYLYNKDEMIHIQTTAVVHEARGDLTAGTTDKQRPDRSTEGESVSITKMSDLQNNIQRSRHQVKKGR
jgi:hypothetical protein